MQLKLFVSKADLFRDNNYTWTHYQEMLRQQFYLFNLCTHHHLPVLSLLRTLTFASFCDISHKSITDRCRITSISQLDTYICVCKYLICGSHGYDDVSSRRLYILPFRSWKDWVGSVAMNTPGSADPCWCHHKLHQPSDRPDWVMKLCPLTRLGLIRPLRNNYVFACLFIHV